MEVKAKGIVTTIKGAVVDVLFPTGQTLPDIFTALEVHIGDIKNPWFYFQFYCSH